MRQLFDLGFGRADADGFPKGMECEYLQGTNGTPVRMNRGEYGRTWFIRRGIYCFKITIENGHQNTIDYITIASEGNAIDFGDTGQTHTELMGSSCNSVRMCIAGGNTPGQQPMSNIDFITIATVGNSRDFGNLSVARRGPSSLSDSHGGLGGF